MDKPPSGDASQAAHPGHAGQPGAGHAPKEGFWALTIGSVGVVYGDIGTSPLYAFRVAVQEAGHARGVMDLQQMGGTAEFRADVLGVVSLIFWALMIIVTFKYVLLLLRADNRGEGGTLSLMALANRALGRQSVVVMLLAIAGAALFYGDAVITPAISVLSAVEGLKLVTPRFGEFVVPITVVILVLLFAVQSRGTAQVARFFGPITVFWFLAMGAAGLYHLGDDPGVALALNPAYAVGFIADHGFAGARVVGAVFLAVTGAEALYADLGHFGKRPIQAAWLGLVLPALTLNYLGQASLVLADPSALDNPFYKLAPEWGLVPMVVLATMATVIASQAVITGAFSLSRQAVQLGLLPRLEILHTSALHSGQIYIPRINTLLFLGVVLLAVMFQTSDALAAAYGIAVTGTMVVTALLAFVVVRRLWNWPLALALGVIGPFLLIDLIFLGSNLIKIAEGGWLPLLLAIFLMLLLRTWVKGTSILLEKARRSDVALGDLIGMLGERAPVRVPGTAVFLTGTPELAPQALLHNLKHNKVLHQHNIVLTVRTADLPRVPEGDRLMIEPVNSDFTVVTITFGFMETPNVPAVLAQARKLGLSFEIMATTFFLSRRSIRPSPKQGMPLWQDKLFIGLARNASNATDYFHIPTGRVMEVGTQVTV